jgi:hypothetical protein
MILEKGPRSAILEIITGAIRWRTTLIQLRSRRQASPAIAALNEKDLPEAARIIRVAFGTFLGAPDLDTFWTDRDYAFGRQRAPHVAAFGATLDGKLVGSNFAVNWEASASSAR